MADTEALTPTKYIEHHLTFKTQAVGDGGFWVVNVDSIVTAVLLGLLTLGFFWFVARGATAGMPGRRQNFVEWMYEFVETQVKGLFHGDGSKFVAPTALIVFTWVVMMNAMDFLPADIMTVVTSKLGQEHFRLVPTADVNTTFALSLSVWLLMIFFAVKVKGVGGWIHELTCTPFGTPKLSANPLSWIAAPLLLLANFAFQCIEYISKPLSHSLRLFGNMYAGELIFLLIWMLASVSLGWAVAGWVLGLGWALFHILIVLLQAYIFMMLTIVYIAMAHESH